MNRLLNLPALTVLIYAIATVLIFLWFGWKLWVVLMLWTYASNLEKKL